mmetsp:Transcript_30360/g.49060  ORF Transcript_30360/g.49060 Transcript_30360/m.49060 type:complete len:208 (+) Transcript_30360:1879-2502(+)
MHNITSNNSSSNSNNNNSCRLNKLSLKLLCHSKLKRLNSKPTTRCLKLVLPPQLLLHIRRRPQLSRLQFRRSNKHTPTITPKLQLPLRQHSLRPLGLNSRMRHMLHTMRHSRSSNPRRQHMAKQRLQQGQRQGHRHNRRLSRCGQPIMQRKGQASNSKLLLLFLRLSNQRPRSMRPMPSLRKQQTLTRNMHNRLQLRGREFQLNQLR